MRSSHRYPSRSGWFIALMTTGFLVAMAMLPLRGEVQQAAPSPSILPPHILFALQAQPAQAQQQVLRIEEAAAQVYQQLPDLPLENQYVNRETGRVSDRNTLVSRLMRYHSYVKGRPMNYRLDWKLTLADYLGANERVITSTYPGQGTLQPDPLPGDLAAINRLSRDQRNRLVQALVDLYTAATPSTATPAATPATTPATTLDPAAPIVPNPAFPNPTAPNPASANPRPAAPPLQSPQPGDAQLLLP